tara:strand:- start:106 stop:528 length:423 start_codon:yes stop_codon:yes gene_type:complete
MADANATVRCDASGVEDITFTLAADVAVGVWDFLNNMVLYFPVAVDISEDAEGVAYYRMKKAMLPKATGVTITAGDLLFYSTVTNDFSNVTRALTDVVAAFALADAASGDTEVLGRFEGDRLSRITATINGAGQLIYVGD